jgi:MFS family permease
MLILLSGIVEAPYYPGAIYIISNFYTRTEVATRIAILYTGNILATAFAGLIAAGIFQLDGARGMAGWRWLFIIQGVSSAQKEVETSLLTRRCRFCDWSRRALRLALFARYSFDNQVAQ